MTHHGDDERHGIGMGSFPPLADYGFLSDRENSALVGPDGTIDQRMSPIVIAAGECQLQCHSCSLVTRTE